LDEGFHIFLDLSKFSTLENSNLTWGNLCWAFKKPSSQEFSAKTLFREGIKEARDPLCNFPKGGGGNKPCVPGVVEKTRGGFGVVNNGQQRGEKITGRHT